MSVNQLQKVFEYQGLQVRTVVKDGEPWFVAKDVCEILGIANHRDAVSRLDDDEKGVGSIDTLGGIQEAITINEFGLYSLILSARNFKDSEKRRKSSKVQTVGDARSPAIDPKDRKIHFAKCGAGGR